MTAEQLGEPNDKLHHELAAKLRKMLDEAPVGRMTTIHNLFGILYAQRAQQHEGLRAQLHRPPRRLQRQHGRRDQQGPQPGPLRQPQAIRAQLALALSGPCYADKGMDVDKPYVFTIHYQRRVNHLQW